MLTRLDQIRLGIIVGIPGVRNEQGQVLLNHSFARLIEEFQRAIPDVRVCLPVLSEFNKGANQVLNLPPESIVSLPPMSNVIKAQKYYFQARRVLRSFVKDVDALFIRMPFQLPSLLRNLGKPKLLQIVSNTRAVIDASSDYHGLMGMAARSFARFSESQTKKIVREPHTRVATHGTEMWRKLGCREGRVVISSCMYRREMEARTTFQLNTPPRLLFVGYLRPEKGIHTLLDAFDQLRRTRPLKLTLVGGLDRQSAYEGKIRERIANSPFRDDITTTGMLDYGPELFEHFRSHDIYILPSLSEGTPRTLIEARAFGCPVIGSRVGGIPDSIDDGKTGLLFTAGDGEDLSRKITQVLDDTSLRTALSEEGFRTSVQHSIENFSGELLEELATACGISGGANESALD